MVVYLIFT